MARYKFYIVLYVLYCIDLLRNKCSHIQQGDSQLVTRSTRHKEAVNSSQANKQANNKAVLPQQYNYPYQ